MLYSEEKNISKIDGKKICEPNNIPVVSIIDTTKNENVMTLKKTNKK